MMAIHTEKASVARTTEAQPRTVEGNGNASFAHNGAAGKREKAQDEQTSCERQRAATIAYRSPAGRIWRYRGKRGRVLAMLAGMPGGLTQWDTLPWHTRLGGTIHALRCDGLAISTEIEGDDRHARYRLDTPGQLIKQPRSSKGKAA